MERAVCFKCGTIKIGAVLACPSCGQTPQTDDELVMSCAMSSYYFDAETLQFMGTKVREGDPPKLDEKIRQLFLEGLRQFRQLDMVGVIKQMHRNQQIIQQRKLAEERRTRLN